MRKKPLLGSLVVALALVTFSSSLALEKLKFTTPVRDFPPYYLLVYAAQEKGIWQAQGLEVEWVPFTAGVPMYQAVGAKAVGIGATLVLSNIQTRARGLPVIALSSIRSREGFYIWVRADSRLREPRDLAGARIGVSRLGSGPDAYASIIAKKLGIEKQIKVVGVGGIRPALALFKTGAIDAGIYTLAQFLELKLKGELRELVSVDDYLPKDWIANVVFARQDFVKDNPDTVKKVVEAVKEAVAFVLDNPRWALEKMKTESRFSDEAARLAYDQTLNYTRDKRINKNAIQNVRAFLIENGMIPKEKAPAIEELYTEQFTRK